MRLRTRPGRRAAAVVAALPLLAMALGGCAHADQGSNEDPQQVDATAAP